MVLVFSAILIAYTEKITVEISPMVSKENSTIEEQLINSWDDIREVESQNHQQLKIADEQDFKDSKVA